MRAQKVEMKPRGDQELVRLAKRTDSRRSNIVFKGNAMATVDVEELRSYLLDYYGSAMASGVPAALLDVADVDRASGEELCRMAERIGIDLERFTI